MYDISNFCSYLSFDLLNSDLDSDEADESVDDTVYHSLTVPQSQVLAVILVLNKLLSISLLDPHQSCMGLSQSEEVFQKEWATDVLLQVAAVLLVVAIRKVFLNLEKIG